MNPPCSLVSVITAVYQGGGTIAGAVYSVLSQTYANLELTVVDDGSTDQTWELLQSISDPRLRTVRQENRGAAAARNLGLSLSQGRYIAFIDADDHWMPTKLEAEIEAFHANGDPVGIVYSWYYAVDEKWGLSHRSQASKYSGVVFNALTRGHTFILPSASIFRREIFDDIGGFNATRRYHEDFALVLRACRKYPAFPSRRYSVVYRQSLTGKGRSVLKDYHAAVPAWMSIVDEIKDILSEPERIELLQLQRKALFIRFLMYGFNDNARRLLREIPLSSLPGDIKGLLGFVFALSGINLLPTVRRFARLTTQFLLRQEWIRVLSELREAVKRYSSSHGSETSHAISARVGW